MKRFKKLALIVCSLLLLFVLTGCNKTVVSAEKILEVAKKQGLKAEDYSESTTEGDNTVAVGDDEQTLFLVYVKYKTVDDAKTNYKSVLDSAKEEAKDSTSSSEVNLFNYNKYTATTKELYYFAERVEDTIIVAQARDNGKEKLDKFMKEIGY